MWEELFRYYPLTRELTQQGYRYLYIEHSKNPKEAIFIKEIIVTTTLGKKKRKQIKKKRKFDSLFWNLVRHIAMTQLCKGIKEAKKSLDEAIKFYLGFKTKEDYINYLKTEEHYPENELKKL